MLDHPSDVALLAAEQLLPYAWRSQPDYEAVLFDVARALDRWRQEAHDKERNRIADFLDFHEYDIASGMMDPLRVLRRELGIKE